MPIKVTRTVDAASTPYEMKGELAETAGAIAKRYGSNCIQLAHNVPSPGRIGTGVFTLDFALLGGIPHNRTTMIAGERHSGKTTLSMLIIAEAQRLWPDKACVLLDIEGTFDSTWASKLGVRTDQLIYVPCDSGEMAVDIGDALITSEETSLVVADSIAALTPMKEVDSSAEDAHVGLQARLVGAFIRRTTASLIRERKRNHRVTLLLLNQYRSSIGKMFGDPRVLPGGKALEFATTVQISVKNKENKGKSPEGLDTLSFNEHAFSINKNKLNGGPRSGEFILVRQYDDSTGLREGEIDDAPVLLSFAKRFSIYSGAGSRWSLDFDDYSLSFGKAQEAITALREDPDLFWDLRTHIIKLQAVKQGMPEEFIQRIV